MESLKKSITATNEPGHIDCGAPDFKVVQTKGPLNIGYMETKDIGKSLDEAERLEFSWYMEGEHQCREKPSKK